MPGLRGGAGAGFDDGGALGAVGVTLVAFGVAEALEAVDGDGDGGADADADVEGAGLACWSTRTRCAWSGCHTL